METFTELTAEEQELLSSSSRLVDASVNAGDGEYIREFEMTSVIFAVDAPHCIVLDHKYHHRDRLSGGTEHYAEVKYGICSPVTSYEARYPSVAPKVSMKGMAGKHCIRMFRPLHPPHFTPFPSSLA